MVSEEYAVAGTELHYHDPYQLLVATILSAQCTDKRVNMITPALFARFPSAEKLSDAEPEDVFELIRSCSYPNNKAKNLVGMARKLVSDFQGTVPEEMEELIQLPGVGRKTANVVLSVVFNKPAMAVDTHVFRVAARLGLTVGSKTPEETERQLLKLFPSELLPVAHHCSFCMAGMFVLRGNRCAMSADCLPGARPGKNWSKAKVSAGQIQNKRDNIFVMGPIPVLSKNWGALLSAGTFLNFFFLYDFFFICFYFTQSFVLLW